jgi:hypothetical protein
LKRFLNLDYEIITEYNNDTAYNFLVDGSGHILTDTIKNNLQNKLNEYRENYKVLIHKAGDVDPNSALVKDESYSAIIKKVPMFDRVYAAGYEGYKKIFDSYESLVSDIKSLQRVKPDGATISLGIKNTSGIGEYEIFNMNTSTWQAIDDISLSFDIGVKYNSDVSDENIQYNNNIIIETIRDYINEFDEISFGINTIFELVKEKLPSIEYMIIYKINQYPASEVQSIRKKGGNSIVSDKLCVKEVIDIDNTDLNNKSVKFKPDITVKIIP